MSKLKPIPDFKSEEEEFEFWSTADTTEYLDPAGWRQVSAPVIATTEDAVFLTIPRSIKEQVERLSRERKVDMQEILRQLLAAGLQQQRPQPGG